MTFKEYTHQDVRMEYCRPLTKEWFLEWILQSEQYQIKRYMKALRAEEYYTFVKNRKVLRYWYFRRKNILGARLGFFIPAGCFGPDLRIWHYGSIIVNPESRIGSGCDIHGNCCIGSKGADPSETPTIGNNVNIGQNAQILGQITIADGVRIGANAVVTKDCLNGNVALAGVPAKEK